MQMDLNKLAKEAYEIAKAHGWHEEENSDEHYLMLILTEIAEAVQADRKDKRARVETFKREMEEGFSCAYYQYMSSTVEDELSDIVIRCFDLEGLRGIDLESVDAIIDDVVGLREDKGFIDLCYMLSGVATSNERTKEKICTIIASVFAYCKFKGIEIEWFVEQKMKYNRLRPFKHGGLKY